MTRCFGCTSFGNPTFALLSRAAAKSASARLRKLGVLRAGAGWEARLAICRGCPLRTVVAGVPHCGKPFLRQVRRAAADGCGCPLEDKAKSPGEHCPLTRSASPPRTSGACDCKWCVGATAAA